MKVGEFFVELGVDAATGNLTVRDMIQSFGDLDAATLGYATALTLFLKRMSDVTQAAMDMAVGFSMFEAQTGLSAQTLQKWQIVGEQVNVEVQAITSSIQNLQRNMAEIRLGRGNIAPFQLLGIDPRSNPFAVLEQLRHRLRGMDRATAVNLMSQMGIDPSLVKILQLTNKEFSKFMQTARGLTGEQARDFERLRLALTRVRLIFRDMSLDMASHFAVTIEMIAGDIERLLVLLRETPGAMRALQLGAAALAIAFAPITAAIAGLLLLLEDLAVYRKGGKSIIGELIETFKEGIDPKLLQAAIQPIPGTPVPVGAIGLSPLGVGVTLLLEKIMRGRAEGGAGVTQDNRINMEIHSTAPADEVGEQILRERERQIDKATMQLDNGGR